LGKAWTKLSLVSLVLKEKKSISEGELAAEAFQSVFRDTDGKLRDGTVRMGGKEDGSRFFSPLSVI
jgi:hypothetical protein